jgi:hypothetical protein
MLNERRRKRSSFAGLALQYWLSAVARKKKMMALVLADSAGLLVASSFNGPEAEELAALAPLLARAGEEGAPLESKPDVPLTIRPMQFYRDSMYLCAVGNRRRGNDTLNEAAEGVDRILDIP